MNFSQLITLSILTIVLLIGAAWDLRFHKIPNWLTFPVAAMAIGSHTCMNGFSGLIFSLGGMAVGIGYLASFLSPGGYGGR